MKKVYASFLFILISVGLSAQVELNPIAGGLEAKIHEIKSPDLVGYSFYDMLKNGYYDQQRSLDFDSLNMTFMGNWPLGQSFSMAYSGSGNIFLVGAGAGVILLDASDPSNPQEIATIKARALVDASFYDTATSRLYLAAYFSGVEIWDLSDMENPKREARVPTSSYPRGGVFARENYMYVVTVADGVYIYEVSDPENISMEGHYSIPSSTLIWNSAMEGDNIYCAGGTSGCRIVDVSDPANPQLAGTVTGNISGVWAESGILYSVSSTTGLRMHDVSDPSNVTLLGQLAVDGYPYRVSVSGGIACIANSTTNPGGGIQVIDVSDPSNPVQQGYFSGYATFIAMTDQLVAFSGGGLGCTLLDISEPANPQQTYNLKLPWSVNEMFVTGDLAFTGSNGFRVFDVSDKSNPQQIGYHETAGDLAAVSGNVAVFIPKSMGASNPVNIMDISDPQNPFKRGHYTAPVMTYDIDLFGNYAFIASWWDGFRVVDFSNPDSPVLAAHKFGWVNSNSIPGVDFCYVQALDISGNYLYLIDYQPFENEDTKGLYVFDITNPEEPVFVSRYAVLLSAGYDVEVQAGFAYVADKNGGLEVIDVSDPENPYTTAYLYLPDVGYSVDVDGSFAYVANYILGGVQAVNISDPESPEIAGFYQRSGCFALGATVEGSYVYIADGPAGFQIYDNLIITDIEENKAVLDNDLRIWPNPAMDFVNITVNSIAQDDGYIEVRDISGRKILMLFDGVLPSGESRFIWEGKNGNGQKVPTGIYLVRAVINGNVQTGKVMFFNE